jgi:threonine/homoserine/homoserine lactone efflux protein
MIALFATMFVLAAMPSSSVLIVISRSVTSGFSHGVLAALGIVTGDIVFILITILGLSLLAETMGDLFVLVKYLGAAYLLWMGISLLLTKSQTMKLDGTAETSLAASFMSGLLYTLADQKAILFYLGFFPAFVDLLSLTLIDMGVIVSITLIAVGGIKVFYAYMASSTVSLFSLKVRRKLNIMAGCFMMAVGLFIVLTECASNQSYLGGIIIHT